MPLFSPVSMGGTPVYAGPNLFFHKGQGTTYYTSPDGITWTTRATGSGKTFGQPTWFSNRGLVIGQGSDAAHATFDGSSTALIGPYGPLGGSTYLVDNQVKKTAEGYGYGAGGNGSVGVWVVTELNGNAYSNSFLNGTASVAFNGTNTWAAVGGANSLARYYVTTKYINGNINNWSSFAPPVSGTGMPDIAYLNGVFITVCGNAVYTTPNIATASPVWTQRISVASGAYFHYVEKTKEVWLLTTGAYDSGTATSTVYRTTDGTTWTSITVPASLKWCTIAYGNGTYFLGSSGSTGTATSPTGASGSWTSRTGPAAGQIFGVTFAG